MNQRKVLTTGVFLFAFLLAFPFLALLGPRAPSTLPDLLAATVRITYETDAGKGTGAGTLIEGNRALTAAHLCPDGALLTVEVFDWQDGDVVGGHIYHAFLLYKDEALDLALLLVDTGDPLPYVPVLPNTFDPLFVRGAELLMIGCPLGGQPVHSRGELTDPNYNEHEGITGAALSSAPTVGGNSGGGLFLRVGSSYYLAGVASRVAKFQEGFSVSTVYHRNVFVTPQSIRAFLSPP